jgi:hypothetical protein
VARAVTRVLARIHAVPQPPDPSFSIRDRNRLILARFDAGESHANLARAFGMSDQRVHPIVRGQRRSPNRWLYTPRFQLFIWHFQSCLGGLHHDYRRSA